MTLELPSMGRLETVRSGCQLLWVAAVRSAREARAERVRAASAGRVCCCGRVWVCGSISRVREEFYYYYYYFL